MMTIKKQQPPRVEFQTTADGSQTLFVPELNEHYHSVFGAMTESLHIFIGAGLHGMEDRLKEISILEIGFGTGLNVLLTWADAQDRDLTIKYTSIEKYPLTLEMASQINFPELISSHFKMSLNRAHDIFRKIHLLKWNHWKEISGHFHLLKIHKDLHDCILEKDHFDLVYFDAFGPDVQPEMWSLEVFQKMNQAMKRGAVLVTYSTKGTVKRNLKDAGFSIEKLPGPPGKREILRAVCL